ncbi:MAG: hypothetical protein DBY36_07135 [Clostridiales bacterium]|nr:MAG: hypothetical protein DBY36_07135 [Clostridiales bacterium]
MEDLKLVFASNLIRLRTGAGLKQTELGEKLNYSDKSISKWERAEALPDAAVLKKMAEIFGVTVDYLLTGHDQWEPSEDTNVRRALTFSTTMVTGVAIASIWTLALLTFVILWLLGQTEWLILIWAIPVSLVTLLVFNSVWNAGRNNRFIVAGLVFSVILLVYLSLLSSNPWQLFLLVVPAEIVVFLSFRIKKNRRKP